jgi:hypothetical protein
MREAADEGKTRMGLVHESAFRGVVVPDDSSRHPVTVVQDVLDQCIASRGGDIHYVHGSDVMLKTVSERGGAGVLMPPIRKEEFFPLLRQAGTLPRKAFSMGEANEKRYYFEARRIR